MRENRAQNNLVPANALLKLKTLGEIEHKRSRIILLRISLAKMSSKGPDDLLELIKLFISLHKILTAEKDSKFEVHLMSTISYVSQAGR